MLANTYVEQIIEFDSVFAAKSELVELPANRILQITELEDQGIKDHAIANHFGTYEYIIVCNN